MSFDIILPQGTVAIYGRGLITSQGNTTPGGLILEPDMRYGTVYKVWDGGGGYVYGGDVVFWKDGSEHTRVVTGTNNDAYTIVPARLATKDLALPS